MGAWVQRFRVYNNMEIMTADGRQENWRWKLRAEGSYLKVLTGSRKSNLKMAQVFKLSKTHP